MGSFSTRPRTEQLLLNFIIIGYLNFFFKEIAKIT